MMFLVKFVGCIVIVTSVFWIIVLGRILDGEGR
jgi:hypothetical protein